MKKRIAIFLLAMVMLVGVIPAGIFTAYAESAFVTSDECIQILKKEEGFSVKPYWDYSQYTVGYGTRCPDDMVDYYSENGITEAEAEVLLRNHLTAIERDINQKIIDKYGLTLTQNQFDALILFSYNCGTSWAYESNGIFHQAIVKGATGNDLIRAFALWSSAGNQIKTFLLRRRLAEANLYINGVYAQTPPDNYCYVLYNANGGVTSPKSQGYDANLTATPFPVPTYAGYNFLGWFTEKTGGQKITVLDASTKNKTLYAQWADSEGNPPSEKENTIKDPVTVTVTGSDVNLRKGPGTNYTIVGQADKGQQLTITETASGTGYVWGKFDGGWIALEFTNYDTAVNNTQQTPVAPPATETPEQKPENQQPETQQPEQKPESQTPPQTTVPPVTEPEQTKVTGTVQVQDLLRVRSGPGTSYAVVQYLQPNEKVEILEQQTVGAQKWGKVSNGWICMDYVILDSASNDQTGNGNTGSDAATVWVGTVNVQDVLRIRSGPSTSYSIVGYLDGGTVVTITEKKNNGSEIWGKIGNGWISLDYVRFDSANTEEPSAPEQTPEQKPEETPEQTPEQTPAPTPETITGTVNVQDCLRIRTGPGTSYDVVGYLDPDTKVTITEREKVSGTVWGKISDGWISLDYVILDAQSSNSGNTETAPQQPAQPVTKTIVADCLRVRTGAGTSNTIVDYLYYGAKVEILETATASDGTLWGRISNGWISMDYAK